MIYICWIRWDSLTIEKRRWERRMEMVAPKYISKRNQPQGQVRKKTPFPFPQREGRARCRTYSHTASKAFSCFSVSVLRRKRYDVFSLKWYWIFDWFDSVVGVAGELGGIALLIFTPLQSSHLIHPSSLYSNPLFFFHRGKNKK